MKPVYRNAFEVFPKELVHELQKHHVGLVYIPKSHEFYKHRADLIWRLHGKGVSAKEIAELCGISRRRVYQILAKERAEREKIAEMEADKKISLETPEFAW